MTTSRRRFFVSLGAAAGAFQLKAQEQLDFLRDLTEHERLDQALPAYLKRLAHERLAERRRTVRAMQTPADVAERRAYIRETMREAVGGFPERTPLNPKVVGVIEKDGHKIEKIVFESQPNFFVTANLYAPTRGSGPFPGVLYPLGHERGGKSYDYWQRMLITLARNGYVALTWDPLGQGERAQMYDRDFKQRKLVRSTTEHTVLGVQCLLAGDNVARYTIWDGIRALDYLLSRPEVDSTRIACTGNSGGGTHTAYLSALEDRIHVAAPSCYLTGWDRLLDTIGPQDAEQVLLPWIAAGLDHTDFVIAFAPKPYLILSAIRDFFSIAGARNVHREAREVYELLDAADRIAMAEVDRGHGYHQPNRVAAYQWFAKWLKDEAYAGGEPETEILEFEDLAVTSTGQVATALGGETVHSLNRQRVESFDPKLPDDLPTLQQTVRERAARRSGFDGAKRTLVSASYGTITRDGYRIEKILYRPEPEIPVPALLYLPDAGSAAKPAMVYAHGGGKSADAGPGGDIEHLVRQGAAVLAIDARGLGETSRLDERNGGDFPRYFGDYDSAMTALLLGKSLAAMRAVDILAGIDLLERRDDIDAASIAVIGKGKMAVPALYAALFDDRIERLALEEGLASYRAVVEHRIHRDVLENVVVGALREFDLPDIVAALAPRPVRIINPVDPLGNRLWPEKARKAFTTPAKFYNAAGAAEAFEVVRRGAEDGPGEIYAGFLS